MQTLDHSGYTRLCDTHALDTKLATTSNPLPVLKEALQFGNAQLRSWFDAGADPQKIVFGRTWLVDQILVAAWSHILTHSNLSCSLIAAGGYGRGELHPHSDIDLLVLLPTTAGDQSEARVGKLITLLWDIGLQVGHSVRNIQECVDEACNDLTVITNLMETRWLAGSQDLFIQMQARTGARSIWPSERFFEAKLKEQAARHHRFHDTAYKLEPNVKESPGGLRDIQMIAWVTKRHFGNDSLEKLVARGFLTEMEFQTLADGQRFLWKIRNTLHFITNRCEDRLLFDYQRAVAEQMGYTGTENNQAIEGLMKEYYRTVMELNRLNEMLLQLFQEAIIYSDKANKLVPINSRFQACNGFLEVTSPSVFKKTPAAILEMFLLLQQHSELKGVRAATIRLIRSNLYLINKAFRNDPVSRSIFMEILCQPIGVTDALRKMNKYGVLAAYIPPFAQIVGQMQYDLIHKYTVDEHTLFLVRNLRRFTVPEFKKEFPQCSRIMKSTKKPEILFIAGLFHDIAKGRGGNHSELGQVDAEDFCIRHGISEYNTCLITWLVGNHLLMSTTAQRRDTSDPDVIRDFALHVGSQERLDHLYLLTVADIRATSPELWNQWKDALLLKLYNETKRALRKDLVASPDKKLRIRETQEQALKELLDSGLTKADIDAVWDRFSDNYFLRCDVDDVVWHTLTINNHPELPQVLTEIHQDPSRGVTSIFVYSQVHQHLFAITTAVLDQLGLTITDAHVIDLGNDQYLYTYMVLGENGQAITDDYLIKEILNALQQAFQHPDEKQLQVSRQAPRYLQHFPFPTQVTFSEDEPNQRTIVEIVATDRPGLLSRIASTFSEQDVVLQNAKIGTFGSRVEDVFFVTDGNNGPLQDPKVLKDLHDKLIKNLGEDAD